MPRRVPRLLLRFSAPGPSKALVLPPLSPVPDAPLSPSSSFRSHSTRYSDGLLHQAMQRRHGKGACDVPRLSEITIYIYICIYALHVMLPLTCSVWSCVCFALLLVSNHVGRLFPVFPTTSPCRDGATEALTTADLTTTRDKQIKRKGAEGEGRQVHERVSRRRRRSARRERWLP